MGTQVKFGLGVDDLPRPAHRAGAPFVGRVAQCAVPVSNPYGEDPPRRAERTPQKYGHGNPEMRGAGTDMWGIATPSKPPSYVTAETCRGEVLLPNEPDVVSGYIPSVGAINNLTHAQRPYEPIPPTRFFR